MIKIAISKQQFADLYILDAISPYLDKNLLNVRRKLIFDIANEYLKDLKVSLSEELKTAQGRSKFPVGEPEKIALLSELGLNSIDDVEKINSTELSFLKFEKIFSNLNWNLFFGGDAWANVAFLCNKLEKAIMTKNENEAMRIIDLLHQTEHNTSSIFDTMDQGEWINDLLTEKSLTNHSIAILSKYLSPEIAKALQKSPIGFMMSENIDEHNIADEFSMIELDRKESEEKRKIDYLLKMKNRFEKMFQVGAIDKSEYDNITDRIDKRVDAIKSIDKNQLLKELWRKRTSCDFMNRILIYYIKNKMYESIVSMLNTYARSLLSCTDENTILALLRNEDEQVTKTTVDAIQHYLAYGIGSRKERIEKYKKSIKEIMSNQKLRDADGGRIDKILRSTDSAT